MCNCTSEVWSFGPSRNDEPDYGFKINFCTRQFSNSAT
jgi:hypothetical protein